VEVLVRQAEGEYRWLGEGGRLALEVNGPTIASCLARAVEGFTAAFAEVHPAVVGRSHHVELDGDSPAALLQGTLEETVRLGQSGEVAVMLTEADVDGDHARLCFEAVPVRAARHVTPVDVHNWQVRLDRVDGAWSGRVICDLR
jgi:hypothetical protein